jgi:hypothetical protein
MAAGRRLLLRLLQRGLGLDRQLVQVHRLSTSR